jgi:hypothetical protein
MTGLTGYAIQFLVLGQAREERVRLEVHPIAGGDLVLDDRVALWAP